MALIETLAALGFVISLYALYVERRLEHNRKYVPACDIRKNVSCSRAFMSEWGNLLGLPNSAYGLLYYGTVFALAYAGIALPLLVVAIAGAMAAVGLAVVSYGIQRNFCLVCTAVYAINLVILGVAALSAY